MSHKHFIIFTLAAFLIHTGISTPVLLAQIPAQTPASTSSQSLTNALQHALKTDKRLTTLTKNAAKSSKILSIEILDSQLSAVLEIELAHQKSKIRYPLKFTRATLTSDWQLAWAPHQEYTQALLNMTSSDALPTSDSAQHWTQQARIVAFPIIATRQQIITPFGTLPPTDLTDQSAQLTAPDDLIRHATRWIHEILEDAPAPAAIDLILDARLSWKATTRLIMATSAVGFFRVYLITTNTDKSIAAIPVNAPIFDTQKLPDHVKMLVVSIYPLSTQQADKKHGFRIAYNNQILKLPSECHPDVTLCTTDPAHFSLKLQELTQTFDQTQHATHIMFAASKHASLQTALDYLQATAKTLQIPTEKTFLGFIQ